MAGCAGFHFLQRALCYSIRASSPACRVRVAEILLDHGARLDAKNSDDQTVYDLLPRRGAVHPYHGTPMLNLEKHLAALPAAD